MPEVNITDFGATGLNADDAAPAFRSFRTWALTQGSAFITLHLPAGDFIIRSGGFAENTWFNQIPNLRMVGAGVASTKIANIVGTAFRFANGHGIQIDNSHHARVHSCVKGQTWVRLMNLADLAMVSVGKSILMTGYATQNSGYPPNHHWFEFKEIVDIDEDTGTLFFASGLTHTYLSTWPHFEDGNPISQPTGGAAMFYVLADGWGLINHQYENFLHDQEPGDIPLSAIGRRVTFTRVDAIGSHGIFPTQNEEFTMNDCDMLTAQVEMDKYLMIGRFNNCIIKTLKHQSSSIYEVHLNDTQMTGPVLSLDGTPRKLVCSGGFINHLRFGCLNHGSADEVVIDGTEIDEYSASSSLEDGGGPGADTVMSFVGAGRLVIPYSYNAAYGLRWCPPGTYFGFIIGSDAFIGAYKVLDVSHDGSNAIVLTNYPGTDFPSVGSSPKNFVVHPCPKLTINNMTGGAKVFFDGHRNGYPLFSSSKRTLSPNGDLTSQALWGKLGAMRVEVQTAGSGLMELVGRVTTGASTFIYDGKIDLTQVGMRTITAGGVVGSVGSDADLPIGTDQFSASIGWVLPGSGSSPRVMFEVHTEQGISSELIPAAGSADRKHVAFTMN